MSTHEEEVLRWRESRIARLTGPDGWLTVVGLAWLQQGENSVGSNPESRVQLPGGPSRVGSITVAGGAIAATFDPEAGVTHDGELVTTLIIRDDSGGDPTLLRLGSLAFYVIRRAEQLAVRVKDSGSPARRTFAGIEYYPLDPRWRVRARFEPYDPPGTSRVPTVVGKVETYQVPGALAFEHEGVAYGIDPFLEEGETDLFIIFGDLTNGSETYGGGRYLYAPQPDDRGDVMVDFNRAYNPPCVFTSFATCALPPPQNKLPIPVEAGEKLYRGPTVSPVVPRG